MDLINTLQVVGCHFDVQPPGWCYPRHHHHLFELLCCLEGEVIQEVNRDNIILRPGDWILIKAGMRHQTMNTSGSQYGYFNVHFDLDVPEIRSMLATAPYRHIPHQEAERTKLSSYVAELERIIQRNQSPEGSETTETFRFEDKLLLQSYTLLIIHDILTLLRELPAPHIPTAREGSLPATDVAHAIEEKLSQGINEETSVASVAKELNLSRSQCSKLFSKVYGLSPRQYISRQKLNSAKELLVTTNLPMTDIAEKLGFRSASHFSRQFRRWTGQSPTDYKPKQ
ncbi:transcriptional regulator, AraC family [Paenibacillus uliginis N3/975]|uniref:Transcriptional regulator, AraC family n=1 Tax=Paenibacillus uliginis N3/975 TaxID=1313296 RepID=A0A1X7HLF7_9BACL|nr:AraC family transcriptional regulator [Paenibacillus uliginis]SMF87754.1 transcriptional regulator, AraC family [Paenibacillus uliginis N3/975]